MSISATIGKYKPTGDDKIPASVLRYITTRNRHRMYDFVVRAFKASGLTQAQLARRLDSSPEVISRLLARPRNIEADTFINVIFAITGGHIEYVARQPIVSLSTDDQAQSPTTTVSGATNMVLLSAEEHRYFKVIDEPESDGLHVRETSDPETVEVTYDRAA